MTPISETQKQFEAALNWAYRYLSNKPRSIFEMRQYLKNKNIENNIITAIIESLKDKQYLDDLQFTEWYVKNRARFKPKSIFALGYELKHKGIETSISDLVLSGYKDEALAQKAIASKINQWSHLDKSAVKKKTMNFLRYRGFSYDVCIQVYESLMNEDNRL